MDQYIQQKQSDKSEAISSNHQTTKSSSDYSNFRLTPSLPHVDFSKELEQLHQLEQKTSDSSWKTREIERLQEENHKLTTQLNQLKDDYSYLEDRMIQKIKHKDHLLTQYQRTLEHLTQQIQEFNRSSHWKKRTFSFSLPKETLKCP